MAGVSSDFENTDFSNNTGNLFKECGSEENIHRPISRTVSDVAIDALISSLLDGNDASPAHPEPEMTAAGYDCKILSSYENHLLCSGGYGANPRKRSVSPVQSEESPSLSPLKRQRVDLNPLPMSISETTTGDFLLEPAALSGLLEEPTSCDANNRTASKNDFHQTFSAQYRKLAMSMKKSEITREAVRRSSKANVCTVQSPNVLHARS